MDSIKATISFSIDYRRSKKGDRFPVRIIVYFNGEKKRYSTGIDLTRDDWAKLNGPKLRDDQLRVVKRKLHSLVEKGQSIIDQIGLFSFTEFDRYWYEERRVSKSLYLKDLFEQYIQELEKNEQVGTAVSYRTTINSIERFQKGLRITELTKEWLMSYERFLLQRNLSPSTVGIYMRQLRCIVNRAIDQNLLKREKYPFRGYTIPTSRNIKKALKEEQLRALFAYETEDASMRKALDFWLFSYISNGMNMKDICLLRPANIEGDFFHFIREKTKNTKKKDARPIKVPLLPRSKEIIDRWRSTDPNTPYLFPILEDGLHAKQVMYRVQDFIYFVNKHMKRIALELGIEMGIGTYVARHSHSTVLKRKGVPTELIKENLGHSSVLVTESYLADFSDEVKQEYSKLLLDL